MESPKNFGALLTLVVKHLFEGASAANLKDDYFGEVAEATPEELISQGAVQDMEIAQFETLVQQSSLTQGQQDLFVKFWRAQKPKAADLNEPTAIVELTTDSGTKPKLVRFEMDKEKLAYVLQQINGIQQQLVSKVSS